MKHPFVIDARGKLETAHKDELRSSLRAMLKEISGWDLRPTKLYMNKADFDDIVKWGKEEK